jgi:hypothetical protein
MEPAAALGLWHSSFGAVKLEADTSRAPGHLMGVWVYDRNGREIIGYFTGLLDGNVLEFNWHEPAEQGELRGSGFVVFDPQGQRFDGRWWTVARDREGAWQGWRQSPGGQPPGPAAAPPENGPPENGPPESAPAGAPPPPG